MFAALNLPLLPPVTPAHTFEVRQGKFLLDGKPSLILAGEMHYFRVPHQLWRQRIRMAKAMGLNTISTYVAWNIHEPEQGKFNFKGDADVASFIRTCQDEGMYVMLRPGPYICAEWEFGGYPYWLLREKGMKVRTSDPAFMSASRAYLAALAKQTVPLQITHGGNIVMVQVENEYGSYGSDHAYMGQVKETLSSLGYDVPLYVAEGGSLLARAWIPGTVAGVNGGSWPGIVQTVDKYTPGGPYISPEFYPGWLDHWGEPKSITDGDVSGFEKLISNGVSVSLYMFHGGTNFGFMNGANFGSNYEPDITSYDYDAPLNESGRPTAKYFKFRDVIAKVTRQALPPVPSTDPIITLPKIELKRTGTLWSNLPRPTVSTSLPTMEDLGQAYGDILYQTRVTDAGPSRLELKDPRDFVVVMVNRKIVGEIDRRRNEHGLDLDIPPGGADLQLLVENSGRINYGGKLPDNLQGITHSASLGGKALEQWSSYRFPLSDPLAIRFDGKSTGPSFYGGEFKLDSIGDGFLDMHGWHKGEVWVNGHALGRFWWVGPQQTLYVPSVWLRKGKNSLTVFDLEGGIHASLEGSSTPILTDLKPERTQPKRDRKLLDHVPNLGSLTPATTGELMPGDEAQTFKFDPRSGRYLTLETRSTFENEDFASLSELDLLDAQGHSMDRSKWKVAYVDSEETAQEDGRAENLIDGDVDSIWHTVWSSAHKPNPHIVVFDLGADVTASGVRLTPRQGVHPAKLKDFSIYLSPSL